ncbi:sigma factor-like helix-turn-helix DNA-binding protein [Faecalibacterium butyricigenerans]
MLTAPLGNHRGTHIEEGSKSGGAKADGGGKVKGEHKDAVFFVDVIFALAVFVAQRVQRLRDPLTGIDEDLTGLGSLTALETLKTEDLEIITMYAYEGYDITEISKVYGVSRPTISIKIKRITKFLKNFNFNATN